MSARSFVIFAHETEWRNGVATSGGTTISDIQVTDASSPSQAAADVASALTAAGYRGEAVLLAVPSAWCLVASISTQDLPANDRKAMLFRLEEKLPLAAEGIVAEFVASPDGSAALGVCTRIDRIAPLV